MPSGGWRSGMLVTLQLVTRGSPSLESWRNIDGIIVSVDTDSMVVSVKNLSGWILDHYLYGIDPDHLVRIIKRSEDKLYLNNVHKLKELLNYSIDNVPSNSPIKYIFNNTLKISDKLSETESSEALENPKIEQILTVYHKELLHDESKKRALMSCSQCDPVTVIQGPPGTGKTTTLAAAVLSAVANGDTCLVVTPSHAACDAATCAVVQHWPHLTRGQVRCNKTFLCNCY